MLDFVLVFFFFSMTSSNYNCVSCFTKVMKIPKSRFWLERLLCSSGAETLKFVECFTNLAYSEHLELTHDNHVRSQSVNIISHFSKFAIFDSSKATVLARVTTLLQGWIVLMYSKCECKPKCIMWLIIINNMKWTTFI